MFNDRYQKLVPSMGYLVQKSRLNPIFTKMAPLPLKTLIGEKNARV
jgi:hypothetical protein